MFDSIFNKVADHQACIIKKRLQQSSVPVNFTKFLKEKIYFVTLPVMIYPSPCELFLSPQRYFLGYEIDSRNHFSCPLLLVNINAFVTVKCIPKYNLLFTELVFKTTITFLHI